MDNGCRTPFRKGVAGSLPQAPGIVGKGRGIVGQCVQVGLRLPRIASHRAVVQIRIDNSLANRFEDLDRFMVQPPRRDVLEIIKPRSRRSGGWLSHFYWTEMRSRPQCHSLD